MILRRIFSAVIAAGIALAASSCGYNMGSAMHPQIKTIAIATVGNESMEPSVSGIMRQMLAEQFQVDNSLKVKSLHEADCILYCKVTKFETNATGEDSTDQEIIYRPAEWYVTVTAEFTVIIPSRNAPLVPKRTVTESAYYQVFADYQTTRSSGIKAACRNAAEQVVKYTTRAW